MHFVPIPEAQGKEIIEKYGKRVICEINGGVVHCAIQKNKDIGYFIMVGKSTKEKIKVDYKEELQLLIKKDDSKYKAEISEELWEVLKTDIEAKEYFEALTPGKKRTIIHRINKAKQSDTRINRALKIAENLKMGITDLKELLR